MATYITGRDLTLTIDGDNYDAQASTVTLTREINQAVLEVLSGRAYKSIDETATLSIEMFADWGAAGSVCDALWDATNSSPDTALSASFDCDGDTFTMQVFPNYPVVGGGAVDVLTSTVELVVLQGTVVRT
jgi:hypothetical protein